MQHCTASYRKWVFTGFFLVLFAGAWAPLKAQDSLPSFQVVTHGGNKILVSWVNGYRVVNQISIQRSFDSTRNFKTILSVPDPTAPQNGFVDSKAPNPFMYYRLFIVLDSGRYLFTPSKKAFWDTVRKQPVVPVNRPLPEPRTEENNKPPTVNKTPARPVVPPVTKPAPAPEPEKIFYVKRRDSLLRVIPEHLFRAFRDSVLTHSKDTLLFASTDTILIKPFVPKEIYRPSIYVFTQKDGNVSIRLPDADKSKYLIKFFEEDKQPLFELKDIKDPFLILDKVNFLHAGWFRFELYENGKLLEKNKFQIPKDQ